MGTLTQPPEPQPWRSTPSATAETNSATSQRWRFLSASGGTCDSSTATFCTQVARKLSAEQSAGVRELLWRRQKPQFRRREAFFRRPGKFRLCVGLQCRVLTPGPLTPCTVRWIPPLVTSDEMHRSTSGDNVAAISIDGTATDRWSGLARWKALPLCGNRLEKPSLSVRD